MIKNRLIWVVINPEVGSYNFIFVEKSLLSNKQIGDLQLEARKIMKNPEIKIKVLGCISEEEALKKV